MMWPASVALVLSLALLALSYDPSTYLEVYPDPRDPEVLRGRTPLYFALIQSLGGPQSNFDGSGSVAGVKVALDRINNDSSLLPGYTLHYTFTDSKCRRTESLNAFFTQIHHEPKKIALIGSGCSTATESSAEVSHFYNITQISCFSSSTVLRNRVRFPSYFQLLPTGDVLAFAYYGAIKEFGWSRISLLVQNENVYTTMIFRLKDLLDQDSIEYSERTFDSRSGISGLGENPFAGDFRIFLFSMHSRNARLLLCEAYKRGIHLPRYLILTLGWYSSQWWREEIVGESVSCTIQQREEVLWSSLAFHNYHFLDASNLDLSTTSGITGRDYLTEELKFIGQPPLNIILSQFSPYCYDATWALAYALNRTLNGITTDGVNTQLAQAFNVTPPFSLEDFNYNSNELESIILQHLSTTSFNGLTGPVTFEEGIRNLNDFSILQYQNKTNGDLQLVKIGTVVPSSMDFELRFTAEASVDILRKVESTMASLATSSPCCILLMLVFIICHTVILATY